MWRSQLGAKEVKTITQADDDDWETDPDFVVRSGGRGGVRAGLCYVQAEICAILLLLRYSFRWYPVLPKSKFSDFGRKPWTIIRRFDQNRGHSLWSFYSSLEGATELKFVSFCSS